VSERLEFEVLAMDSTGGCNFQNERQLAFSLMSNSTIHSSPDHRPEQNEILFGSVIVKVHCVESERGSGFARAFLIKAIGSQDEMESLREKIVAHLQRQDLKPIYILKDEISENIACQLYPGLYRVENLLRGYLIKFMSTRLGPKWWEATATNEVSRKAYQRKNNEKIFSKYVDNNAYLIDFSDLGKMIYEQSTGFNSLSDVVRKVIKCEDDVESLKKLKGELQSNYQKFFKEHFKDKEFQEKWEKMIFIRNKVAHNSLFTQKDLDEGKALITELTDLINSALGEIPKVEIDETEKNAIKASFVAKGLSFDEIDEEGFLYQLADAEKYFNTNDGFVGLAHFVKNHLGSQGYSYSTSYEMVNILEAKGKIETYQVNNPEGEHPVTAIRTIDLTSG